MDTSARRPIVMIAGKDPHVGMGGHASYVRTHARAAIRAGFEPHIFCSASRSGVVEGDFGVVHRTRTAPLGLYPHSGGVGFRKNLLPWHAPFVAASVERFALASRGPHLIHAFGTWGYIGVMASRRLRRKGVEAPTINSVYTTTEHECREKLRGVTRAYGRLRRLPFLAEYLWTRLVVSRYEGLAYTRSRLVTVNYESVRRRLRATYGEGAEVRRWPYTTESAFLRDDATVRPDEPQALRDLGPRDAPLVVAVSRHDPRKGLDVLLQALARLRSAGVRFRACLVGGGPLLTTHRRLAARLGVGDVTAIEGWVPDPMPYLRQADVFVLPSRQEGSGSMSLLEALQAGVAGVASNVDGIPEDVVDGDSTLLVEPGNVDALCRAVARLVTDAVLRERLARRSREVFVRRFSPDPLVRALRDTYAELGLPP